MKEQTSHINKQLRLIKMAKILVACLLSLSLALEFVMLNLISVYKEREVVVGLSYDQVTGELMAVSDTIYITVSQKFHEFIDYIKKKHEEKSQNKTQNHHFASFNLFIVDKFSFQFGDSFYLEKQNLNAFYQEPFTQKTSSDIFHPPQS